MSGSRRNFQYVTDNGQIYLFNADESNVEQVNGTVANIGTSNVNQPGIPRGIRPRKAFYGNPGGTRTIGVICSTVAIYNNPPVSIDDLTAASETFVLIRKLPERAKVFPNFDTGLTDGDTPL